MVSTLYPPQVAVTVSLEVCCWLFLRLSSIKKKKTVTLLCYLRLLLHSSKWTLILVNYYFETLVADHSSLYISSFSFTAKNPRPCESHDAASQSCRCSQTSERQEPLYHSETMFQNPILTNLNSKTPEAICGDQDQPLSFDHTRLAVATAAFRGTPVQQGSSEAQNLARVLQCSLPNIINSSLRQTFSTQNRDEDDRTMMGFVIGQKSDIQDSKSECDTVERMPGKSSSTGTTEEMTGNVLGLDCYSSSDEGSYT